MNKHFIRALKTEINNNNNCQLKLILLEQTIQHYFRISYVEHVIVQA